MAEGFACSIGALANSRFSVGKRRDWTYVTDGAGVDARWDIRMATFTAGGMAWDGGRYLYSPSSTMQVIRRVDLQNSGYTQVVYGQTHPACTCTYSTTCPTCYSESDSVCGLNALLNNQLATSPLAADPQGRYVYLIDQLRNSIRRINTTNFCPFTLIAPSSIKPQKV